MTPCFSMATQNPSGGVTSYASLLPHSEATLDHVLLPLPPYSTAKYPRVRPDPSVSLLRCMSFYCVCWGKNTVTNTAGQNPTFCRIFLVFAGHLRSFQNTPQKHWPYTSNLCLHAKFSFCIKMQDTNFAAHLAEFAGEQDINFKAKKQDNPAKSRTVGNYDTVQCTPHNLFSHH